MEPINLKTLDTQIIAHKIAHSILSVPMPKGVTVEQSMNNYTIFIKAVLEEFRHQLLLKVFQPSKN